MNLNRFGASILVALAITLVSSAAGASTPTDTHRFRESIGIKQVTLTSGSHPILVIHDDAKLCETLVKPKKRIARDFGTKIQNVVIDRDYCFASWYAKKMPNLVFNFRNAVLGAPGIPRRYSRIEQFTAANEGLVIWFNRPSGWFMLGVPPFLPTTAKLEDIALYLTGNPDTSCLDKFKDKLTGDHVVRYGYVKTCPTVEFINPTNWFVNDELTTWPFTHRDPGAVVSSKKFRLVLDRTMFNRAVYDLYLRLRMDGGPKNARIIQAVNSVKTQQIARSKALG